MMKEQHRALRPALFLSLCVERKGNGRAVSHFIPSGLTDVVPPDEGIRASGRRNKGLRAVKHHVPAAEGPSGPKDVVLPDEGTRVCGR